MRGGGRTAGGRRAIAHVARAVVSPAVAAALAALVVAAFALLPSPARAADPLRCAICGKPITQSYLVIDGSPVHPECFTCVRCGKPIDGDFTMRGDRRYHPECALALSDKCASCGKPITGRFYKKDGASYCERCFEERIADRCAVCGEPLLDESYAVNRWGDSWHAACASRLVRCASCDRAIPPREEARASLPDGRPLCSVCRAEGIVDEGAARTALARVAREIARDGFDVDAEDLALALCDKQELVKISGSRHTSGHTAFHTTLTNGVVSEDVVTVRILTHLRRDRFDAVAAHELVHVYLHREIGRELPAWLEEGLCNWVASLVLERREGTLAEVTLQTMEADTDPVYGGGYRRLRRWMREGGSTSELLATLRLTGAPPRGM